MTTPTYHEAVIHAHEVLKSGRYSSTRDTFCYAVADMLTHIYGVTHAQVFQDIRHLQEQHSKYLKEQRRLRHQQENEARRIANLQRKATQ